MLKSEQNNDKHSITELEKCVQELTKNLNNIRQLLEKQSEQTRTLPINELRTPSLFENIKHQKQTSDQQQNESETTNKTPALATDPNGKSLIENKQDTQVTRHGCTTFRLNPFRRMDNSSNTTIGLKKRVWYDITSKKKKRILDELSHLWYFS